MEALFQLGEIHAIWTELNKGVSMGLEIVEKSVKNPGIRGWFLDIEKYIFYGESKRKV